MRSCSLIFSQTFLNKLTPLQSSATEFAALQQEIDQTLAQYQAKATLLSQQRQKAAKKLANLITDYMQKLSMKGGRFEVNLQNNPDEQPTAYGKEKITERHRHRYEVNPHYHKLLEEKGLVFSGMSPDGTLVEYIELPNHPFFVGTQAHPEFTSRPLHPNPLFFGFIAAAKKKE